MFNSKIRRNNLGRYTVQGRGFSRSLILNYRSFARRGNNFNFMNMKCSNKNNIVYITIRFNSNNIVIVDNNQNNKKNLNVSFKGRKTKKNLY